jgi:hypothetical protein
MSGKFDGIYHNVPNGFVYLWEQCGWEVLPHVYCGTETMPATHHAANGQMMIWRGEGEPKYPARKRI